MPLPIPKCIPGFRWPLIRDFAEAVDACRFNAGDLIHDDPRAYVLPWADARKLLTHSIREDHGPFRRGFTSVSNVSDGRVLQFTLPDDCPRKG